MTLTSATLLAGLSCAPLAAAAEGEDPYSSIELQARSNLLANDNGWNLPPGSSWNSITPDINDAAEVAFRVQSVAADDDPTDYTAGLWFGGSGEGEIVYRADPGHQILGDVAVNEAGDVAFPLADGGVNSVLYRYDGSAGEAGQVDTDPVIANGYSNVGIDESTNIGFQASIGGGRALGAVRDGSGVLYLRDNNLDPDSPYGWVYSPSYNDAGQFAVKLGLADDVSNSVEIRLFGPGGTDTLVLASSAVDPDSPWSRFDNGLGLSDNGLVAVVATRASDGVKVVLRTDGTTTTEIATVGEDGLVGLDYFSPDVNDAGQVVFRGSDADGQAVFVGDGTGLTKVAGDGTEVETDLGAGQLGQHDSSPVFGGAPRINNAGDVSFTGGLHPVGDDQDEWGSGVFVAYADGSEEPPANEPPMIEDASVEVQAGATADFTMTASDPDGDELTWSWTDPADGELTGPGPDFTYTAGSEGSYTAEVTVDDGAATDTATVSFSVTAVEEPEHPESVERVFGQNRYGTAAEAATAAFEPGVDVVYVSTGLNFPDALTSAALAGSQAGPVLLTRPDELMPETKDALTTLDPDRIVVVGGTAAISGDIADELEGYTDGAVERIFGDDRYETAAKLAAEFGPVDTVYLATGLDYPDALAASARAGSEDVPVLLVRSDEVPEWTAAALQDLDADRLVVLGGDGVVSDTVLEQLEAYTDGTVERVFGDDRYETAVKLSADLESSPSVYVATGSNWPDALSSAAVAAHADVPVLLVRADELMEPTAEELERLEPPVISVLGGDAAVGPAVIELLKVLDYTD